MNLLARWFGRAAVASSSSRWIVLDVETTGLDMRHDKLLAIAAVAIDLQTTEHGTAPRIALADSFEAVLRRESRSTDKDNILLHGIGVGAQRAGVPPAEALLSFARWAGESPRIAFHAEFDRTMIERAAREVAVALPAAPWLDLAPVAEVLEPEVGGQTLDDWLDHFGIACHPRHQAAADTLATAELLLRLWPAARRMRSTDFASLAMLEREQRWLAAR